MEMKPLIVTKGEGEVLNPLGTAMRLICPGEKTGRSWSLTEIEIPERVGPPLHHHPWDEAYYILEGRVRFAVGSETADAGPGDFIFAPGGTPHAFSGLSKTPARALIFDAPAASEAFFRELVSDVRRLPEDLDKLPGIGLKHRLTFLK